jgi:hypothetical protein
MFPVRGALPVRTLGHSHPRRFFSIFLAPRVAPRSWPTRPGRPTLSRAPTPSQRPLTRPRCPAVSRRAPSVLSSPPTAPRPSHALVRLPLQLGPSDRPTRPALTRPAHTPGQPPSPALVRGSHTPGPSARARPVALSLSCAARVLRPARPRLSRASPLPAHRPRVLRQERTILKFPYRKIPQGPRVGTKAVSNLRQFRERESETVSRTGLVRVPGEPSVSGGGGSPSRGAFSVRSAALAPLRWWRVRARKGF